MGRNDLPSICTTADIARYHGVSVRTARSWCQQYAASDTEAGLPCWYEGRQWFANRSAVAVFRKPKAGRPKR